MGGIRYPVLSDFHPKGKIAEAYGVMNNERGFNSRATFIIDKSGVLRYKEVHTSGLPDNQKLLAELAKLG
jgi:peroxiredoxin (alkyl hydroperoxide reductase subunit C)